MNVPTGIQPETECGSTIGAERRIQPGLKCINCAYDLRGLSENGNCPECGQSVYQSLAYAHYRATRNAINDGAYNLLIIILAQAVIPVGCLIAAKVAILGYFVGDHALAMDIDYNLRHIVRPERYPFLMLLTLAISLHMAVRRTRAYRRERTLAVLIVGLACWLICWGVCILELGLG